MSKPILNKNSKSLLENSIDANPRTIYKHQVEQFIEDNTLNENLREYLKKRDKINRDCQGKPELRGKRIRCPSYETKYYWLQNGYSEWDMVYCERCKNKYVLPKIRVLKEETNITDEFLVVKFRDLCLFPDCFEYAIWKHKEYSELKLCCENHKSLIPKDNMEQVTTGIKNKKNIVKKK